MIKQWKVYAFWIGLSEAVGALAGWLTRDGVERYNLTAVKPPLTPPGWLFPVVWTVLYALMGLGAARARLAGPEEAADRGINLFLVQLGMNFLWTILFFNYMAYGWALILLLLLWVAIAAMALAFGKSDRLAGLIQIPYLVWVGFALYLNFGVWRLNG